MSRAAPLLLDALDYFPAPPTFIPASPIGTSPIGPRFNPPPSLPPSAPLPPVPSGPSRISETDTLLLLNTAGPARSRSKLSLREHRDSIASTRSSVSTRSSPQTPSSAAQSLHRPSLTFSIDENDLLDDAPVFPKDDGLEDIRVPVPPLAAVRRTPPRTTTPHRESIALTSVAIPAPDSDTEPDFDALPDSRAPSPDIATILAKTPRPRLASLSHRPPNDAPWEEDFIDDYGRVSSSVYSNDSTYAFGYPDPNGPDAESINGHVESIFEEPNSDADSDLDLHTSLPQLMLHHGFLSPHSKLLPHSAESLAPSPVPSPASSLFPRTDLLPRDTRDTPKRRVRHRDGKTLRGGIGLTTGLGWSDSEDEDAPSALTRRISSLNLNQSASKLGLSRSSSLSLSARASTFSAARTSTFSSPATTRSSTFSSSASTSHFPSSARTSTFSSASTSRGRRAQSEHDDTDIDEFGAWQPRKKSAPPTSWARRSDPSVRVSRTPSSQSIRTEDSALTTTSAETAKSATSTSSLPLMRTRSRVMRDDAKPLPRTPSLRRSPSTASTGTISRPNSRSGIRPRAATGLSGLPTPHMRALQPLSMQSTPHPGLPPSSSSSSLSSSPAPPAVPPLPASVPRKPQMRPLRLQPRLPVLGGDRAPVPVPSVLLGASGIPESTTASSLSSSASSMSMLSASTSATSVSLLSPSPSANGLSSLALCTPSPYARGPPSPGFAPPTPTTPSTPVYEMAHDRGHGRARGWYTARRRMAAPGSGLYLGSCPCARRARSSHCEVLNTFILLLHHYPLIYSESLGTGRRKLHLRSFISLLFYSVSVGIHFLFYLWL
ncbi:hypothetical protein B0H13DRAFT_430505 [Mycena leptocephala]|nr:hypothetical protein B0H13DRAFT_430505 [Mycena leptocephala]